MTDNGLEKSLMENQMPNNTRESEILFRLVAENFADGIIVIQDEDLRYVLVEGPGLANVGLTKEEMIGKRMSDLFPPDYCDLIEIFLKEVHHSIIIFLKVFKQHCRLK